jgi:SAM-dependent methyltransferase
MWQRQGFAEQPQVVGGAATAPCVEALVGRGVLALGKELLMKALMLGAGFFKPERKIVPVGVEEDPIEWTTLDNNPLCEADIKFDLESIERCVYGPMYRLPIPDETFDEIHAYQVLEHFGKQGDFRGLFSTFRELWRILKPEGLLYGDTPAITSPWAWGDPGHTRIISEQTLSFLTRRAYEELGKTTSTDYRSYVDPCWWLILHSAIEGERYAFVLKKTQ